MSDFIIYGSEREAGISDLLLSTSSLRPFIYSKASELAVSEEALSKIKDSFNFKKDIDLYPVFDILVSTGWNKNDEYFDRDQVLRACGSSINKPFNIGHNPVRIIGHIFGDQLINDQFDILQKDSLPQDFHVLTGSVIYTQKRRGPELETETSTLIEQIEAGEWFVSVEALFPKFHYILSSEKETKLIERKEDTAFLSKYLRVYGGQGVYKEYRIGRMLLDIVFSGKGLVHKPANSNSIILNSNSGEQIMVDKTEEVKRDFEGEIATLKTEIETLKTQNSKLEELSKPLIGTNGDLVKANEELKKTVDEQKAGIEKITTELSSANELVKKITEEKEGLQKINSELSLSIKRAGRITKLVDKGVEKTQAEQLVDKLISTEDGVFDIVVSTQAELIETKKKVVEKPVETQTQTQTQTTEESVATAAEQALENTEEVTEPTLSMTSADEIKVDEKVAKDIAEFLA